MRIAIDSLAQQQPVFALYISHLRLCNNEKHHTLLSQYCHSSKCVAAFACGHGQRFQGTPSPQHQRYGILQLSGHQRNTHPFTYTQHNRNKRHRKPCSVQQYVILKTHIWTAGATIRKLPLRTTAGLQSHGIHRQTPTALSRTQRRLSHHGQRTVCREYH